MSLHNPTGSCGGPPAILARTWESVNPASLSFSYRPARRFSTFFESKSIAEPVGPLDFCVGSHVS